MAESSEILKRAEHLISKERHDAYGDATDDFTRIAKMWDCLFPSPGLFRPHEITMAMICVKLSRLVNCPASQDSWTDIAGYAALGWEVMTKEEKK